MIQQGQVFKLKTKGPDVRIGACQRIQRFILAWAEQEGLTERRCGGDADRPRRTRTGDLGGGRLAKVGINLRPGRCVP
jgi:hypothetical protein